MKKEATVEASEVVHKNKHFRVVHETFRWSNGQPGEYFIVEKPLGFVIILAFRENEIAVVRQYRPTTRTVTVELPAGAIEDGELPEAAAYRELREELAHEAFSIESLPPIAISPGMSRNTCYPFIVRNPTLLSHGSALEESEVNSGLTHEWIPVTEWRRMIRAGEIVHGDSLAAWAHYWERHNSS